MPTLPAGIFPYVLKLLQTTAPDLRQILVFIWTKILALDRSCQLDLVKDSGHVYFIRFLDSPSVPSEERAMVGLYNCRIQLTFSSFYSSSSSSYSA